MVDYFVVNVSSLNTPGLRELQEKGPLLLLLTQLREEGHRLQASRLRGATAGEAGHKPILLEILAPDLTDGQLDDIVAVVKGERYSRCGGHEHHHFARGLEGAER